MTLDTVGPTVSKVTLLYLKILITLKCRKYYCNDLVGHYNDLGGRILLASAIENSIDDSGAHWIRVRCYSSYECIGSIRDNLFVTSTTDKP